MSYLITNTIRNTAASIMKRLPWWSFFLVCAFYAIFAFSMGIVEILSQLGLATEAKFRAAPFLFVTHALAGGVALITGPLQFNRTLLKKYRQLHRISGRMYVFAIWVASLSAFGDAMFFDVTIPAKILFAILAVLWFTTTTIAYLRIRKRKIKEHREWMIRSFSLSFFSVTFSFWVPGLTGISLPVEISYPLAVFLSWFLNLALAEIWIRQTRSRFSNTELTALEYRHAEKARNV